VASTEETKKLVGLLKSFAKSSGMTSEGQETFLKAAYDHCVAKVKADEPLSLESLANAIWPENPSVLKEAIAASESQISDGFVPDGRSLKSFVKIKGKTPYWSLELDRQALVNGQAKYDPKKRTLTLSNLPSALEAELTAEMSDGSL
jgi:nucleoid-associated protein